MDGISDAFDWPAQGHHRRQVLIKARRWCSAGCCGWHHRCPPAEGGSPRGSAAGRLGDLNFIELRPARMDELLDPGALPCADYLLFESAKRMDRSIAVVEHGLPIRRASAGSRIRAGWHAANRSPPFSWRCSSIPTYQCTGRAPMRERRECGFSVFRSSRRRPVLMAADCATLRAYRRTAAGHERLRRGARMGRK